MNVSLPVDSPVRKAWERYQRSESWTNTRKWANDPEHVHGSLWASFLAGFNAGSQSIGGAEAKLAELWRWDAAYDAGTVPLFVTELIKNPATEAIDWHSPGDVERLARWIRSTLKKLNKLPKDEYGNSCRQTIFKDMPETEDELLADLNKELEQADD
jgi:hypothetical protein